MPRKPATTTTTPPEHWDAFWETTCAPGHRLQRMVGFWVIWHLYGGQEGLEASGMWSRGGIYRQRAEFRQTFGCEVEAWEVQAVPGLSRMAGYRRIPSMADREGS